VKSRLAPRVQLPRATFVFVSAFVIAFAGSVFAQEKDEAEQFGPASAYEQIVADYQRIAASNDRVARAAAGRLVSFAYRNVIDRAMELEKLNAEDLYALGACHEGLGQLDDAKELFGKSLALGASPRTHLAIVRVHLSDDLALADKHFAAAVDLDAGYPSLHQFRLVLANAHAARRNWKVAGDYLDRYRDFTKSLADSQPGNPSIVATHKAVENRLATLRRLADMMGTPAPPLQAEHWVQGDAVELEKLRGKIVLVDFCAMWAPPSRARMGLVKPICWVTPAPQRILAM
jgi:tetratricopeptide (TPR) repeat protein